ncbi:thiamine pyrophosphokinase, catalytic domain [Roseivivax sp. THAF40]|uniref:thiamine diphosphokinase n=1 Tax=Roseivivax sp. THAF197b TaxID=2588299 RepID=UPI0012AA4B6C|nr:thiamine diphosphokinase [Roseivivax sp. THAF197b]QFS84062.1 thiamine pyrophosphokinase, catalytic domain [Roseivivax sp. THAF197b]QFT47889.1 thiamine pyrophosphokinase, catalytic domain [Roseivivax sp. THAF40]
MDNDGLRDAVGRYSTIVAADSGAAAVLDAGGMPDAVIGDMDSLPAEARAALPPEVIHRIGEQDSTDFDKCLARIDAPLIVGMGFLGRRVDHQLAVFTGLMRRAARKVLLIGAEDVVTLCPSRIALDLAPGTRVSLWPLSEVTGRSDGLRWPIADIPFAPWRVTGTSNMADGPVTLEMDAPGMLLILSAARAEDVALALRAAPHWSA